MTYTTDRFILGITMYNNELGIKFTRLTNEVQTLRDALSECADLNAGMGQLFICWPVPVFGRMY